MAKIGVVLFVVIIVSLVIFVPLNFSDVGGFSPFKNLINTKVNDVKESDSFKAEEYNIDDYTVALWHMEEGDGNILYDSTVYHNDGIVSDLVDWVPGRFGLGLSFEPDPAVEIPDDPSLRFTGDLTIEAWVRPDQILGEPYKVFFIRKFDFNYGYNLYVEEATDEIVFQLSTYKLNTGFNIKEGQWQHIAGTYDNSTREMRVYFNGQVIGNYTFPSAPEMPSEHYSSLWLGGTASDLNQRYDGYLDEVRISNIARDNFGLFCETHLTEDLTLTEDLICTKDGLIIESNDVTLDCNGHTISGPGNSNIGIIANSLNNITIKNCNIENFYHGISLDNVSNSNVIINNVKGTGRTDISMGTGILLINSYNNQVIANEASLTGDGIHLMDSWNNIIEGNLLYLNKDDGAKLRNSNDNLVQFNTMHSQIEDNGLRIVFGGNGNIIHRNDIYNNPGGINFWSGSINNIVRGNNLYDNGFNAADNGNGNFWNYSSLGNNWDDFLSNSGHPAQYNIQGSANSIDHHPSVFGKNAGGSPLMIKETNAN